MKSIILVLASLASMTVAVASDNIATPVTSADAPVATCDQANEDLLANCISEAQSGVQLCNIDDNACFCSAYTIVVGCWVYCPQDDNLANAQDERDGHCSALASTGGLATGAATSKTIALNTATSVNAASATTTKSSSTSASSSHTSASATATHASSSTNGAVSLELVSGLVSVAIAGLAIYL